MTTKAELESMFLTAEKLYAAINLVVQTKGMSYVEATLVICEEKQIDYEDIKKLKLISPILYDKLRTEGVESGQLKQESTLPI